MQGPNYQDSFDESNEAGQLCWFLFSTNTYRQPSRFMYKNFSKKRHVHLSLDIDAMETKSENRR